MQPSIGNGFSRTRDKSVDVELPGGRIGYVVKSEMNS